MEIKLNYVGKENKCSIFASKEFDFELSGTYYYVFRYELEGSRVYIVKGRNLVKEKDYIQMNLALNWRCQIKL